MPVIGDIYLLFSGFGEPYGTITTIQGGSYPSEILSGAALTDTPESGLQQRLIRAGISVSSLLSKQAGWPWCVHQEGSNQHGTAAGKKDSGDQQRKGAFWEGQQAAWEEEVQTWEEERLGGKGLHWSKQQLGYRTNDIFEEISIPANDNGLVYVFLFNRHY